MIDDNEPELNPQGKAEVQKNKDAKDYELIPTKSLGQFVFRTKLKDYLSEPLPEIIEDDGILGFIFLQPKVIVYNVEFYYVGAVKCNYKCYLNGYDLISSDINFAIKNIIKQSPNSIEPYWWHDKGKKTKSVRYHFDSLGIMLITTRNKILVVMCMGSEDDVEFQGPSSS